MTERAERGGRSGEVAALRRRVAELEAREAERERLEEETSLARRLVQAGDGLMCVHDVQGDLLFVNRAAAEALGFRPEDGIGWNLRRFLVPEVAGGVDGYLDRLRQHGQDRGFMRLQTKDGAERVWLYHNVWHEEPGRPPCGLGYAQDVTDLIEDRQRLRGAREELVAVRMKLEQIVSERTADLERVTAQLRAEMVERREGEQALARGRRIEALGVLAGGVAHEFNNLLTVIAGRSELLRARLDAESPLRAEVEQIERAADRAATLTRQLLAFSRRQVLRLTVADINALVAGLAPRLGETVGARIQVSTRLGSGLRAVRVDPGQIEQALLSLARNARDAMPEGGPLEVETANVDLDESFVRTHPGALPGAYVRIGVRDTGVGMDETARARAFEPFFTARERGRAPDLGLASVYGIVKQHEGYIDVDSEPGRGTTFHVYLPAVAAEVSTESAVAMPGTPAVGETILLVEDEDDVRRLVRTILARQGHTVLEARHGPEALELAEQHAGPLALLLTDVVMPHMSGRQLAERLVSTRPDVRVLYMSGYPAEASGPGASLEPGAAFLPKPFTVALLLAKVGEVLGR